METNDILTKKIGDKDIPRLEPKDIEVQGIRIDPKMKKDGKTKAGDLLVLICKHPDKPETIEMTQISMLRNTKLSVTGMWVNLDEDENIQKGSTVHKLLELGQAETINDLVGKMLPTVKQSEESSYLCIKGY